MTDPAVPPRDRNIVLVGLMGAGKSSIGRRLAHRLGLPFVDADAEIEAAAGCTIPEIFRNFGQAEFRQGERRVIERLLAGGPMVLATGGGAFMDASTRQATAARAVSVWLRADLDVLVARVRKRSNRPLLAGGDPREILARLMAERDPVYALADLHVASGDGPHESVVEAIVQALCEEPPAQMRQGGVA
jgi:shikimate kinase